MTDFDGKTWQQDGFTLRVRVKHDDGANSDGPDWLGTFTDEWSEEALNHRRKTRFGNGHRELEWWKPAITVAEHREGLRGCGYSKGVAEEMARSCVEKDYQRADSFGHEWGFMVVTVTASRRGIELGSSSLGGVESDGDDAYFEECIEDQAAEAIAEANKALDDLLASVHPLDHLAKCAE
jgi:hypothetical protein